MARTVPVAIPFTHPHIHKSALPKTAVDDAVGSSLMGLTTTLGAKLLSNAASGNTKNDVVGVMITIPENWIEGSKIIIRARAKQATTLLTVGTTITGTAKLQGDDAVGSDIASLASATARTLTTTLANYDFMSIPGTTLRKGDTLWLTITLALDDTGGTVNTAAQITRLWAVYAMES